MQILSYWVTQLVQNIVHSSAFHMFSQVSKNLLYL